MTKLCIFCGKEFRGQKKNREHIISDWLVDEADLRKRTMTVNIGNKTFTAAMHRIVGDACEECNLTYATLEGHAKSAFAKLKAGQNLGEPDGQSLLDWLDKVRSGLWLWQLGASKRFYAIRPKFHLDARIGRKDRIALIARYPQLPGWKGLEFWGLGEQFLYMPTAMGMLINNIALVSLSSDFLLARHLRNIVPKWVQNDNLLQSAKLDPFDNKHDVQRLSVLGLPDVIGQCIAPKDAMENDIKLDHVRENPRHKTVLETPVMRLNTDLASTNEDLGNVREVSTDVHAHTLLMEMNVSLASVYMLRDFLRSDFSAVANKGKLEKNITIYNGLLLAEIAHIRDVKSKYRERTGLVLPVEA